MPYDSSSQLWAGDETAYFRTREIHAIRQQGPHCVSTVLAMLTGQRPEAFLRRVNTQDPVSWSEALCEWGMKLAYCPTDARKLKHYMRELVRIDDLFTLSYYSTLEHDVILGEPDQRGWVTGSHIVILHGQNVLDPASGTSTKALVHECNEHYTKRVFRVVPRDHVRGL